MTFDLTDDEREAARVAIECGLWSSDPESAILDALLAAGGGPAPASAVRVRALEWNGARADTPFGSYLVWDNRTYGLGYQLTKPSGVEGASVLSHSSEEMFPTLEAAQAAAQADYDARRRSLRPTPAAPASARAGAEAMRRAAKEVVDAERGAFRCAGIKDVADVLDFVAEKIAALPLPAAEVRDEDVERATKAEWLNLNPGDDWDDLHATIKSLRRRAMRAALTAYLAPR